MAWTSISNALVAVGAKPFATTIQALRDNFAAMGAGEAGAPRIKGQALDLVLPAVSTTGTTSVGWTGLDRADWIEMSGIATSTSTSPQLQYRLSTDNGATWGSFIACQNSMTSSAIASASFFNLKVNIKTGEHRLTEVLIGGSGSNARNNSGTTAPVGSPNGLQIRLSATAVALYADAKVIGGII